MQHTEPRGHGDDTEKTLACDRGRRSRPPRVKERVKIQASGTIGLHFHEPFTIGAPLRGRGRTRRLLRVVSVAPRLRGCITRDLRNLRARREFC